MALAPMFAALVTFDPSCPSRKSYGVRPVTGLHGTGPEEMTRSLSDQGHLGFVFSATDEIDAQVIADTVLPHPADVTSVAYLTNDQLNVRQGARDLV